jgi:hypothetical protein
MMSIRNFSKRSSPIPRWGRSFPAPWRSQDALERRWSWQARRTSGHLLFAHTAGSGLDADSLR